MIEDYIHGGDVLRAAQEAGIAPESILDFSANINPAGLPKRAAERLAREAKNPSAWSRYPDPEALELRRAISRRLDVAPECIVIGAGADALIHTAIRALAPLRCLIRIPAFSEYERASRAYGSEWIALPPGQNCPTRPGDLLILNNPHNPTGECACRAEMLERVASARGAGAAVLVDEAFVDYAPDAAVTRDAALASGVIAIRSLTKFFGCPGLRVGYAVAAPETARTLGRQLPPWPVTTLAANALAEALEDTEFERHTIESNRRSRGILSRALSSLDCIVSPSAANFLFLRLPLEACAADVHRRLLHEHGILVRECDSFAGLEPGRYLRIAVRREDENALLIQALAGILRETSCLQTHA